MFIHPEGNNRQDVDSVIRETTVALLDFLGNAAAAPPMPEWDGWLPATLLPEQGRTLKQVLQDVSAIFARSMNPANPRFLGHMDTVSSLPGAMAEFAAAALNNNMLSVEMSPLLSRLEDRCMREVAAWFGLGEAAAGTMSSGGTLCNLQALAVARNDALLCQAGGLTRQTGRPVLFASKAAHTSLQKAAMVLGLGSDAVIGIDVDSNFRMRPDALRNAIRASRAAGEHPFCIVATAGTTTTGSIDPLVELAAISAQEALWFHVDAAYGGAVILSNRHRHLLGGIELADSLTFNPQKWLYLPKTCATLLFRSRQRWYKAFRVGAPYTSDFDDLVNLGEVSLQGTRHADVLKLWMSLQYAGKQVQAGLIDSSMWLTRVFCDELTRRPYLSLATDPQLNLICFRGNFLKDAEQQEHWNLSLQKHLNAGNIAFFSLTTLHGQSWLRAVLLNPHLQVSHIVSIFGAIDVFHAQWLSA